MTELPEPPPGIRYADDYEGLDLIAEYYRIKGQDGPHDELDAG